MIKSFLIITSFSIILFSSQQIVLVVADDFQTSKAKLELYEDGKKLFSTDVNIGTNGLGWGLGEVTLPMQKDEPLKYEGDKKAPAGIFKLTDIFGYETNSNYKLPYLFADKELICVDDEESGFYNHIIMRHGDEKSFEEMKRHDKQYELGVVVAQNKNATSRRGSCVFLHVQKGVDEPTAGCTAMPLENLQELVSYLDREKNPILIQIPKSSSKEILKRHPELKNSVLLR